MIRIASPQFAVFALAFWTSSALAGPISVIDGDTVEREGERWR